MKAAHGVQSGILERRRRPLPLDCHGVRRASGVGGACGGDCRGTVAGRNGLVGIYASGPKLSKVTEQSQAERFGISLMSPEHLNRTKPVLLAAGPNSVGHLIPQPAPAKLEPMGEGAISAGGVGVGAPTGGPAVPTDNPGLPGVFQTEWADLPSSPNLVLEQSR